MANYYEFKNECAATEWLNNNYKKFINDIQKNNNNEGTLGDALFCYTGSMSKDYNNILKFNNGNIIGIDNIIDKYYSNTNPIPLFGNYFINEAKNDIKLIYNSFSLNTINDDIILFHYFNINNYTKDILKKSQFKINTFISTTMIRNSDGISKLICKNNYNSLLVIKVKKGTQCIPIGNNPESCLREYEIILKPGSQFKVEMSKIKYFNRIKYIIECELI